MSRRYTQAELAFLDREYKRRDIASLTRAFNKRFRRRKSRSMIRSVLSEHGFKSGRRGGNGKKPIYTDVMVRWLTRNWPKPAMSLPVITAAFNRRFRKRMRPSQIKAAIHNRGITCGGTAVHRPRGLSRIFTPQQQKDIPRLYRKYSVAEVTRRLNEKYGTAIKVQQVDTYIANHRIQSGRTGCFEKGLVPWNKGTKGKGICKPNSGTFKKGEARPNSRTKPIGHERIDTKDGYLHVKIAERNPYTGGKTRYKAKHIVEWEKVHGPVPRGHVVRFVDGDKLNCDINNLELVSKRANALLNKRHMLDGVPAQFRKTVMLTAKVEALAGARGRKAYG